MKAAARQLHSLLLQLLEEDEPEERHDELVKVQEVPLVQELSGKQVDDLLVRRHGWASEHVEELGGYFEGQYRFPLHAIVAWQQRQAQEFAQRERAS